RSFMPAMLVHNASEVQGQQDVRVVFVLTVNGRAVRQVHRLINTLYHPRHYFYIHVDSRSEYMYRELLPLESQLANVRLTRERFATIWGGASLLQAHLSFMRSLLEMTDWYWDYYINLSESDYPLKPMQQLTWFLNKYKGYNFLKSNGRETHEFMKKQGLEYLFYECDNHLWRIGTSPIPLGIRVDGGSDWLGLYRDFIRYAVYGQDPLVLGLEEFYKYSLLPVESFFHTLLANSEFCSWVVDNNLHATNWKRKQGCKCQHKNQVDWCGCSPNVFKSEDLNKLLGYKGKATFFGRKFEPVINQDIINTLDSLNGRDISEEPGLIHYWENDYHYQDKLNDRTDTWRSFMESMVHRTQSIMAHAQESCSLFNINIIESHILNVADSFYRYLIKFNATLPSRPDPVTLESQYNYKSTYKILNPDGPIGRLITLEVGSDYDLKELIFRNYARFLGPNSDVRLRLVWRYGGVFNMAVAWIDPSGVVASYENVTVGKESLIDVHNPNLKRPLRPGVWTVNLIYSEKICAELKFLVVPYSRYKGQEITTVLASQLHNGPSGSYSPRNASNPVYKYHIDNAIELHEKSVINGRKMGEDLRMWIDELTAQFWSVEDACTVVNVEPGTGQAKLDNSGVNFDRIIHLEVVHGIYGAQNIMAHAQESCFLFNVTIIESYILNVADSFYRYLIKFNATLPSRPDPVTLESQYNYKSTYKILNPDGPIGRLIILEEGSDYDFIELIFRNYARFLGPNSDVRLRLVWRYGGVFTITVAWIDPSGVVASYENMTEGKDLLLINASNPMYTYHIDNAVEWHEKSVINGRKVGKDLRMWIDELTAQFWSVEDACTVVNVEPVCSQLELCHKTTWSSLSPDPKTQISVKYINKSKEN
ncbi:hypothetical protein DPMN_035717, partial [Dreissena polymorpha]